MLRYRWHTLLRYGWHIFTDISSTLAESLYIKKLAEQHGQSVSDYARAKLLEERVKAKMSAEEVERYDQLVAMANELKKLSDRSEESSQLKTQIINTLEDMNRIIRRL